MTTKEQQFRINNLKLVLANFSNLEKRMTGVTIIRENSSDNWLFNTDVDITEIVPVVCNSLKNEITQMEVDLAPILAQEAEEERTRLEQEAIAEQERLAQEAIEQAQQVELNKLLARMNAGKTIILRYIKENSSIIIDPVDSINLAGTLSTLKTLLESGSLTPSKLLMESLPEGCFPIVTPFKSEIERKQSYLDELATAITQFGV